MRRIKVDGATNTVVLKAEEWKFYAEAFRLLELVEWNLENDNEISAGTRNLLVSYFKILDEWENK